MILTSSTKPATNGRGYRGALIVDGTEYILAGVHENRSAAQEQASAIVDTFRKDIRAKLKRQSLFANPTKAGIDTSAATARRGPSARGEV